jgi:hypothetical protein
MISNDPFLTDRTLKWFFRNSWFESFREHTIISYSEAEARICCYINSRSPRVELIRIAMITRRPLRALDLEVLPKP